MEEERDISAERKERERNRGETCRQIPPCRSAYLKVPRVMKEEDDALEDLERYPHVDRWDDDLQLDDVVDIVEVA